jgi:RNA polymerase sigma factor (sigma-70 family)
MDVVALVERARAGDVDAFTELVRRHQSLAHGCAVAVLHDFDAAHDVVQEAFIAAWRGLSRLAEPALFPAWLRGIVRRQALHALRARHFEPLVDAGEVPSELPSAEERVESERRRRLALAALAGLPERLREPAVLRWAYDCSHAQIAAFLELPVTTVNNRLHAARARLKRRMLVMAKDALRDSALPDDLPARIGRIVRSEGPVVEAHFAPAGPPELFSTLLAADEAGRAVTVEVIQHLPNGRVRCVVRDAETAPAPGARVVEREDAAQSLPPEALASALDRLVTGSPGAPAVLLETGIKVIDVLVPLVRGRTVGIFGGERVGTTVVMEELVRRLATQALSLFTFVPPVRAESVRHEREREGYSFGMGGVQTLFFRGDGRVRENAFDSVIVLSPAVAAARIWPAIDPLASRSRWLDPAVVGDDHVAIAARVRRCLEEGDALEGREDLDASEQTRRGRARRLRRFFGQPFFIAEAYTHRLGTFVPRAEALAACQAIVDGAYDHVPESAFHFVGGTAELLARASGETRP